MRKTLTAIPDAVAAVLFRGSLSLSALRYTLPEQLDRKMYVDCNEVITRYGGKWKSGTVKAHVFASESDAVEFWEAVQSGEMRQRNSDSFYPTPRAVGQAMCDIVAGLPHGAELNHHLARFVEPSCGEGDLGDVIREYWPRANIIGVEIDRARRMKAETRVTGREFPRNTFTHTIHGDFLTCVDVTVIVTIDAIIMNPPFTTDGDPKAWRSHIRHAWSLLAPGGVLASIVPRSDAAVAALLVELDPETDDQYGVRLEHLPAGSFSESGTMANCAIVVAVKGSSQ